MRKIASPSAPYAEFWEWFSGFAPQLAAKFEDADTIRRLDERILALDSRLSWEIGPGRGAEWQLVISPNLDRGLLPVTQLIVEAAPLIPGWQFYPARLPKEHGYQVVLDALGGERKTIDASEWRFVMLRYPDGETELLLEGGTSRQLSPQLRELAAAIVLENLLGEETLLTKVDRFQLSPKLDARLSAQARPIQQLPAAVGLSP